MSTGFYLSLTKLCRDSGLIDANLLNKFYFVISSNSDHLITALSPNRKSQPRLTAGRNRIQKSSVKLGRTRKILYKIGFSPFVFFVGSFLSSEIPEIGPCFLIWSYNHIMQLFSLVSSGIDMKIPVLFTMRSHYPISLGFLFCF